MYYDNILENKITVRKEKSALKSLNIRLKNDLNKLYSV